MGIGAGKQEPVDAKLDKHLDNDEDIGDQQSFCRAAHKMTLGEIFQTLDVGSLRTIAKESKIPLGPKPKKDDICKALLRASDSQTLLVEHLNNGGAGMKAKYKAKDAKDGKFANMKQAALSFAAVPKTKQKQQVTQQKDSLSKGRLRERGLELLGPCVILETSISALFMRAHILYFRSMDLPPKLLLPSLLVAFKKRTFPTVSAYDVPMVIERQASSDADAETQEDVVFGSRPERSRMLIWRDRSELLLYVRALRVQHEVDVLLNDGPDSPLNMTGRHTAASVDTTVDQGRRASEALDGSAKEKRRLLALHVVKIMDDNYAIWKDCLATATLELSSTAPRGPGLERFQAGHILTRVIAKGAEQLAILHEYDREMVVLNDLIAQQHWRRGKKGKWYDRRALVLTTHLCKGLAQSKLPNEVEKRTQLLTCALEGIKVGLDDPWCGIVFRPSLVRRLVSLEKRLKIFGTSLWQDAKLLDADETTVMGIRVPDRIIAPPAYKKPTLTAMFAPINGPSYGRIIQLDEVPEKKPTPNTMKSVWFDRETGDHVSVEELVLRRYKAQGYKGFHSETAILTTLFSLLFFDIIFLPIPGAFETRYQTAPLDLVCNDPGVFLNARRPYVEKRLKELRGELEFGDEDEGSSAKERGTQRALDLLNKVDSKERENRTCIVGVKWDVCTGQDLQEIVQCIGGPALSLFCQLFCEDYVARCSGGPDLITWKMGGEDGSVCRFIEVKGPGDRLRENQKVWIDALKRCDVQVAVCRVYEDAKELDVMPGKKRKRTEDASKKGKNKRKSLPPLQDDTLFVLSDDEADNI